MLFILVFCVVFSQILDLNFAQNEDDEYSNITLVNTTNGTVSGIINATIDRNRPYVAFRGIPYAQPPIGDLRFKPPEPANNWTEIRDATRDGSPCVQNVPITGSEDCLFINVYSPRLERDDNNLLPVLVWIHGGAFIFGDSSYSSFGPDYFLNEGIIFVSFNYRLGIFGFMSTEDLESPGNYGLKDQILALRWIQDNIREFGGNPNEVTIFGESAGAASVSYLVQSPLTTGLYQRAISNSGSALCQWALTRSPRRTTETIARLLGIRTRNTAKMVDRLRRTDYEKLHTASFKAEIRGLLQDFLHGLIFSPTIEPEHDGAVLSGRSHQLLEDHNYNNVSYLMGFNSKEAGGWLAQNAIFNIPVGLLGAPILATYDLNITRIIPANMNVRRNDALTVAQQIREQYLGFLETFTLNQPKFENFVSDDQFVRPIRETARLYSRDVSVYYYRFSYIGNLGLSSSDSRRYSTEGVAHAEDLGYLFRVNTSRIQGSIEDFRTRYRMIRLWSNFAKTGNPTPTNDNLLQNVTWPITRTSSDDETLLYLDIGEDLTVRSNPRNEHIRFWQYLYGKYGHPPYDTY